jgi:hypothetical protein
MTRSTFCVSLRLNCIALSQVDLPEFSKFLRAQRLPGGDVGSVIRVPGCAIGDALHVKRDTHNTLNAAPAF